MPSTTTAPTYTHTVDHDDLHARAMWSHIVNPRDSTSSALIRTHGHHDALTILDHGTTETSNALAAENDARPGSIKGDISEIAEILTDKYKRVTRNNFDPVNDATAHGLTLVLPDTVRALTELDTLPHILYVRGNPNALHTPAITFAGARATTAFAETFTADLVRAINDIAPHMTIATGGSYGIDAAATRATNATALIYSAAGADRTYPAGHRNLFNTIATNGGAIVSETPPGTTPTRWRFLTRNHLLAAHGNATIVPAANARSGAIKTATIAHTLGRPIAAVPRAGDTTHDGCHYLLASHNNAHPLYTRGDVAQIL